MRENQQNTFLLRNDMGGGGGILRTFSGPPRHSTDIPRGDPPLTVKNIGNA
jgi:hypothetical protein